MLKKAIWMIIVSGFVIFIAQAYVFCTGGKEQGEFIYNSHGRRDPFIPAFLSGTQTVVQDSEENVPFILEGIICDPGGRAMAIINNTVLTEHEKINGFEVSRISRSEVILTKGIKKITLTLREEE